MKSSKVVVAVLIAMLSAVFAMSDDGGQQPVKSEKKTEAIQEQNAQAHQVGNDVQAVKEVEDEQKGKSVERVTVKDRLGIDTGMTIVELDEFKAQYIKRAEELGIQNNSHVSPNSYFEHRINLGNEADLKELGLLLKSDPRSIDETNYYSITHSDVILIGTIESVEFLYQSEEDEWKVTAGSKSRYFVKVDKILKGEENFKTLPSKVTYLSPIGKYITSSGDYKLLVGQKYILFFEIHGQIPIETMTDLVKIRKSSLRVVGSKVYQEYFNDDFQNYDEIVSKIEMFEKLNNKKNFYNKDKIKEVKENEK